MKFIAIACSKIVIGCFLFVLFAVSESVAQTDLHITGPKAGFPVALPKLCDAGSGGEFVNEIPEIIAKDLRLSGLFKVINPGSYIETPGRCLSAEEVAFSDWSVIGAEGLVRGEVLKRDGNLIEIKLYLLDVLQQQAVVGKKYTSDIKDYRRVAHRFANEIMRFFTGEPGPFGTQIAFVSRVGRFKELFIMDLDGSNLKQLTRDKGLAVSPAWAPEGDKIVYTSYVMRHPELFVISPEGGSARRVTKREGLEISAKFSPNGKEIIASAAVAGETNLVMFDLRGKLTKRLTTGGAIDVSPTWSPDGNYLAFCSNRGGGPQIYVMPAAGGQARRISYTNSDYCTSPSWSPKGDRVAFVCRNSGNQIFVSNPDGQQTYQLTFRGNNEDPEWSPDSRYLVFSSDFGGGRPRNIGLMPLVGGKTVQLSFSKSEDSQPAWSPLSY